MHQVPGELGALAACAMRGEGGHLELRVCVLGPDWDDGNLLDLRMTRNLPVEGTESPDHGALARLSPSHAVTATTPSGTAIPPLPAPNSPRPVSSES